MKNLIVNIKLYNTTVGAAIWDENRLLAIFQYDKQFLSSELDIAPIIMPIIISTYLCYR